MIIISYIEISNRYMEMVVGSEKKMMGGMFSVYLF